MAELGRLLGRVSLKTSNPMTYLHTSARSGWTGAMLTHMKTSQKGSFEGCWNTIMLSYRLSEEGNFFDVDQDGRLHRSTASLRIWPPFEVARGAWDESSETVNLFIAPHFCETVLGGPLPVGKIYFHAKHTQSDQVIETLLRALLIDSLTGSSGGPTLGDSIVAAIIYRLNETPNVIQPASNVLFCNDPEIRRSKAFISANISSKIRVDELAKSANLSVRHFCRSFKASTGTSPYQYVTMCRLDMAKDLILEGKLSLQEIAAKTGFIRHNNLSTAFQGAFGMTPSQFRNTLR
ncbi:AraC family transcriptional regulator [Methylobacterium sp. J-026]|uniref:AraC family transcriptional regulator n=1 Tax=Methylobacterium sp. J-026 TaxID=2836624 RepID=UPI001FB90C69|nr:AraC family transcriptional regulator [Methylobacterium sp. J-026]MCJ2134972.1 AraC family transcriptional regulator [Methylobacterium sp. J-026]